MSFQLINYVYFLFQFVITGGAFFAAIVAFKDRGLGPWLMLVGSALSLVFTTISHIVVIVSNFGGRMSKFYEWLQYISIPSLAGTLLFTAGLLLYVLQCRGRKQRIEELEAILATKMAEDGNFRRTQ